uniref:NADH dehydrogenase subunit 6 n=1 Tax=Kodaianella bicinctifrons TaxID=1201171 RepID=UPI002A841389|nr:NADH dehydrogenase subunit 6 [Kodaianella bicinctifrons]WOW98889.1 NADH dehydrogenase subunit 6 [Kodaianella bicinctifrons]
MLKFIIMNSFITPMLKHPISLGTMLMLQTVMMSIYISTNDSNSWFSYILFLTIIGGMMVMFMYMSSIASNEKFKQNKNLLMIVSLLLMMILILSDKTMEITQTINQNKMFPSEMEYIKSTSKFFNLNKMNITIMMMMTLLLTMISVTNISNTFEGPLKKT